MKKTPILIILASLLSVIALALFSIFSSYTAVVGAAVAYNTVPTFVVASSTTFSLTTSSLRLLATTTTPRRIAATIQPINCTGTGVIFMNANRDVAATANNGIAAFASSTLELKDYPNLPVFQGAVQGITVAGTCTVLVTEWRSQY